jgi:hypothetical protein
MAPSPQGRVPHAALTTGPQVCLGSPLFVSELSKTEKEAHHSRYRITLIAHRYYREQHPPASSHSERLSLLTTIPARPRAGWASGRPDPSCMPSCVLGPERRGAETGSAASTLRMPRDRPGETVFGRNHEPQLHWIQDHVRSAGRRAASHPTLVVACLLGEDGLDPRFPHLLVLRLRVSRQVPCGQAPLGAHRRLDNTAFR